MKTITTFLMLCFFITSSAMAALSLVGPVDPANGFPKWYKDANGVRLSLCLDQTPLCLLEEVDPNRPISFPDNFSPEAFWWNAEATLNFGMDEISEVRVIFAMEAAFANNIQEGDQISFGRVRLRGRNLFPGTYRITHPYGQSIINVDTTGMFDEVVDIGICQGSFIGALKSDIGPFLVWDPAVQPLPPTGFIGDPNVPHRVTGSPLNTNFARVERQINGTFRELAFQDEFAVMGKLAPAPEEPIVNAVPRGGILFALTAVTLTSSVPGALIFYTADGSDPLTSPTRTQFTTPIQVENALALRFAAVNGTAVSEVSTELYVKVH